MITTGNAGLTNFVYNGKDADTQTNITNRLRKDKKSAQIVGGIALEFAEKLIKSGNALGTSGTAGTYVYTDSNEFKILLFDMMSEAGVDVILHSPICDTVTENGRIIGVVTAPKLGRRVYLGKQFIDCTGDADVATLCGVPFVLGVGEDDLAYKEGLSPLGAQQEIGAMFRIGGVDFKRFIEHLKAHREEYRSTRAGLMTFDEMLNAFERGEMINFIGYTGVKRFQVYNYPQNGIMVGCISLTDDCYAAPEERHLINGLNERDLTKAEYHVMKTAKKQVEELKENIPGFEKAFIIDTPRAGVRETRHIVGEYRLTISDIINSTSFTDSIGKGSHPIDVSPVPDIVKNAKKPDEWSFSIPFKCMIPKNIDNLLVAGKCISATREAYGCIRPTAQCMVLGEAAGCAAALLCKNGTAKTTDIDIPELQQRLKSQGVIL